MHAQIQRVRGPMGHAILETLGCFAAPDICDRIVESALELSPWTAIPEAAGDVESFIEGGLRMALVHYLGEHMAEAVVVDLESVLAVWTGRAPVAVVAPATVAPPGAEFDFDDEESTVRADTHVRPRDPHRMPRLFVVSPRFDAGDIVDRFGGAVTCVRTYDLEQTINSLRLLDGAEAVLLLDGALVAGRAERVLDLLGPYKAQVFVALWDTVGGDPWETEGVCSGAGWAYLPAESTADQVNDFLAQILH